jgi:hypothetical protein
MWDKLLSGVKFVNPQVETQIAADFAGRPKSRAR